MPPPLPKLPPEPAALDLPAMEDVRQEMVTAYRAAMVKMNAAIAKLLDATPTQVRKAEPAPGFAAGLQENRDEERGRLVAVLKKLGVPGSAFAAGGAYATTSDLDLRELAKQKIAARREQR